MDPNTKRLFFGMEVQAPWPEPLPYGRLLDARHRHLTLAFLGNIHYPKMQEALLTFPKPSFKVGFAAKFDECLCLPAKHPHVIAWHVSWLEREQEITSYYHTLVEWLVEKNLMPEREFDFLPHVTLARSPFKKAVWQQNFSPLPLMTKDIHLYESIGNLSYAPIWTHTLLAPFEEMEHTADMAFQIRGQTYDALYLHAALALTFHFAPLISYLQDKTGFSQLEDVIIELNHLVAQADQEIGCPFKAVSFHSHFEQIDNIFHWEMIIDV